VLACEACLFRSGYPDMGDFVCDALYLASLRICELKLVVLRFGTGATAEINSSYQEYRGGM
jgi:hypothetical protein